MYNTQQRARELMLQPDEARRYIAIYESGGICPDCCAEVGLYETNVCMHARTCSSPTPADEVLVEARAYYDFNDRDFPQGRLVRNEQYQHLLPGDVVARSVAAPGYGRIRYRITRTDEQGAWGVVIENTVRIATAGEER